MADVVSGSLSMIDEQLPQIIDRLRTVQIMCRPAVEVIQKWDSKDTLYYCDPPYVHSTRNKSSQAVYAYEMTEEDHHHQAQRLRTCQCKVILSGYPSMLYSQLYHGWRRKTFDIANHAAGGPSKARKKETMWLNW